LKSQAAPKSILESFPSNKVALLTKEVNGQWAREHLLGWENPRDDADGNARLNFSHPFKIFTV